MAARTGPAEPVSLLPADWDDGERELVEDWLASLAHERRLSPHTGAAYRRDLAALLAYGTQQGLRRFDAFDEQHVRDFAAVSHRDGLAPRSIQRRLSAVRGFYKFLIRAGTHRRNPAAEVRAPKAAKRLPAALDVDRMARLLERGPAVPPVLEIRDRAIMELFYSSGLRLAELVGLDLEALDLRDRTVRVLGKGSKTRIVPVGSKAIAALTEWLTARGALAPPGQHAVFVGRKGRRLGPRAVQLRVDAWARRAGLDVRVHPHLFRHSFATHLLESSQDLRGVQELLGHANIGTTQVYTHLDFQHLARVYDRAHPRARRRRG
jgi:integrase/recombinase XerC